MSLKEALDEFVSESIEMLDRLSVNLALFEKGGITKDAINSIYRDIHTLKGTAQLFGCSQIGLTTHSMENFFSPIREGEKQLTSAVVDLFFEGLDIVRSLIEHIKEKGEEYDVSEKVNTFLQKISLLEKEQVSEIIGASESTQAAPIHVEAKPSVAEHPGFEIFDDVPTPPKTQKTEPPKHHIAEEKKAPTPLAHIIQPVVATQDPVIEKKVVASPTAESAPKKSAPDKKSSNEEDTGSNDTIRVQVGLLDNLMNVVGELVLIRNLFMQFGETFSDHQDFSNMTQRLNIVTSELQNEVMKTRMQPIGNILTKFHRVVRDIAKMLSKDIELVLEGTETELDKTLIEAVKDPLTHIVRNSADHGIELPQDRLAANKPARGTIYIRSYHEGGQIVVEVEDNGRGLNRDAIAKKSLEKGIITEEMLAKMSEKDIQSLIFMPGFSTAAQVSTISGRGVGMDVVKTNIEKIGGIVDLESKAGRGTVIRLKIPLTLAIVPALIVSSEKRRYAIPQVKLEELVRIQDTDGEPSKLEVLQGKPVYRLRERLLPLVSLNEILKVGDSSLQKLQYKMKNEGINIVVLNTENGVFGLIVDTIEDSTDIVIKPLASFLKSLGVYSGATVLGDGTVSLTLDVMGLAEKAKLQNNDNNKKMHHSSEKVEKTRANRLDYLTVELGNHANYVIPIAQVNRLEEFKKSEIQSTGTTEVVSYGNQILPIIDIEKELGLTSTNPKDSDTIVVVVVERTDRLYGLKVRSISDVQELESEIDSNIRDHEGVLGSILHGKEIIVVLDVYHFIRKISADNKQDENHVQSANKKQAIKKHILLVEDTGFFRNYIKKILEEKGYDVTATVDGVDGFDTLERNQNTYDLVLSDIEMPKMNGLELAAKIRQNAKYNHIPLVALTTRYNENDRKKGYDHGFDRYLEKLNGDILTNELNMLLNSNKELKRGA